VHPPLLTKAVNQFSSDSFVIDVSQFAPVGKPFLVTTNPFDGLLLKQSMIFSGSLLDGAKIEDGFVPGLTQDSNGQVFF
jgi:hypothetical protein